MYASWVPLHCMTIMIDLRIILFASKSLTLYYKLLFNYLTLQCLDQSSNPTVIELCTMIIGRHLSTNGELLSHTSDHLQLGVLAPHDHMK